MCTHGHPHQYTHSHSSLLPSPASTGLHPAAHILDPVPKLPADPSCLGLCPWPLPDSLRSVYRPCHQSVPHPVVLNALEDTHSLPCPCSVPHPLPSLLLRALRFRCPSSPLARKGISPIQRVTPGPTARPGISRPTVDLCPRNACRAQPHSCDSASPGEDTRLQTLREKKRERGVWLVLLQKRRGCSGTFLRNKFL